MKEIADRIRNIPDFPQPGIQFKDITPLLNHPPTLRLSVRELARRCADKDFDAVAACEARGFIWGSLIACELDLPFVPLRKPGKLPSAVHRIEYELEYGTAAMEVHQDALRPGAQALLVDDLLATGGTAAAACKLIGKLGAEVIACAFVLELAFLKGREQLPGCEIHSLLQYDS